MLRHATVHAKCQPDGGAKGKPEDHQSHLGLSSAERLFEISRQTIRWLLRYFSLDQSDGPTDQPTDPQCHPWSHVAIMIKNRKTYLGKLLTWFSSVMFCFVHSSAKTFLLCKLYLNKIGLKDPTIVFSLVLCLSYFPSTVTSFSSS